jgi:D-threo-aldose 1-dehydrogenase
VSEPARLGFGCSALVSGRTRQEAVRLLEVALEEGITHFDVARVYGTGDAEDYLGEFAARHRDEITLTTKFGIDPMRASPIASGMKRVVRAATRRSRRALGFVRRHSSSTVSRGLFSAEKARASLEVSLRKLRTDRVDAYLLHDCTRADWDQDDLQAALEALRDGGSIRSYGPATSFAEAKSILEGSPHSPQVAQFEADAFEPNALQVRDSDRAPLTITHGCFRGALPRLESAGIDAGGSDEASALLLALALRDNPGGIVLFSSGDPERIRRNAAIARDRPFDPAALDEFARRLRAPGL